MRATGKPLFRKNEKKREGEREKKGKNGNAWTHCVNNNGSIVSFWKYNGYIYPHSVLLHLTTKLVNKRIFGFWASEKCFAVFILYFSKKFYYLRLKRFRTNIFRFTLKLPDATKNTNNNETKLNTEQPKKSSSNSNYNNSRENKSEWEKKTHRTAHVK